MSKIPTQGADNYEFELIGTDKSPFLGYNSSDDRTTVSPQYAVRGSKNAYLKSSKNWANRPGLKTRGTPDGTTTAEVDLIDSYSELNQDNFFLMDSVNGQGFGQSFTSNANGLLDTCKFFLNKSGLPTGNMVSKLYNISGVSGTNAVPSGSAIATSDNVDVASLTGLFQLVTFNFSGINRVNLSKDNSYIIAIEYSGGNNSNYVGVGSDDTNLTASGNAAYLHSPVWTADEFTDIIFYVYAVVTTFTPTIGGVLSSWEWNNSLGRCLPLRVANNKLQVESSIFGTPIWYDLLFEDLTNPAANLTRFVFDSWYSNTEKKDRLAMVRGDANILQWSGGLTIVASGTINTLTKSNPATTWNQDGFASQINGEKSLIVSLNGVLTQVTYTGGENTATLTGVSIDVSTVDANSLARQSVLIEANGADDSIPDTGFNCDMCRVVGNQLCVGSYTSRLIYISAADDMLNFTVPTPPIAGSPELLTLDNTAKGIAVRQGNIWVSAGTKDWYEVTFSNITVGSTLERQTNVSKKNTAELAAAYAHEFIDNWGDDIIYLSQDQQVRDIGTFIGVLNGQKFPMLSLPVLDELAEEDFTGGHLRIIGEPRLGNVLYMTAPNTGRDYMFSILEEANDQGGISSRRIWHSPQIRNISRFAVINGVTYGHSNANPAIYQVWDTGQWHDDSPSGEDLKYTSVLCMGYRSFGRRQGKWSFNRLFIMGYMSQGTSLNADILMDYQGSTSKQSLVVSSNEKPSKQFLAQSAPSIGDSSLGDNPLGDGLNTAFDDEDLLPKFYKINNITSTPCYEYSTIVHSEDLDSRWEIICLGVNPWLASEQAVELQR